MSSAASGGVAISHLRLLLSAMSRDDALYNQFSVQLEPQHIPLPAFSVFYLILKELKEKATEPVSLAEIKDKVYETLDKSPNLLDWDDKRELKSFVKVCLTNKYRADVFQDRKLLAKVLAKFVRELLTEHLRAESVRQLSVADPWSVYSMMKDFSEQAELIETRVGTMEARQTLSAEWDKQPVYQFMSTGIAFMDKLLGGGLNWREVTGFLAPFGSCKTSAAVNLCVNAAYSCYGSYVQQSHLPENQRRCGISVIVSYEALLGELQYRIVQCAAKVEFDSLTNMGANGLESLRGPYDEPHEYEKRFFAQEIEDGTFVCEQDRVKQVIPWINRHTLVIDFSSGGSGGVAEIVAEIQKELVARGENVFVHSVFIDYAGLMVKRMIDAMPPRKKEISEAALVSSCVGDIKTDIAIRFDAPVVLFHQLSGEANKRSKTIKLADKTDSKSSKGFSEHLGNALVASHLNLENVGLMANQKTRRSGAVPPTAFRLYGQMCLLQDAVDYTVDMSGCLRKKSDDGDTSSQQNEYGNPAADDFELVHNDVASEFDDVSDSITSTAHAAGGDGDD